MHAVRNGQLLTFRCPGTSSPAVCRIRFSIASLRCRLLSFCYITDDMESRSQWQCSAKHNGTTRARPDNRKMKVKKFFRALCRETVTTCLHTLPLAVAIPLQDTSRRCWVHNGLCTQQQLRYSIWPWYWQYTSFVHCHLDIQISS